MPFSAPPFIAGLVALLLLVLSEPAAGQRTPEPASAPPDPGQRAASILKEMRAVDASSTLPNEVKVLRLRKLRHDLTEVRGALNKGVRIPPSQPFTVEIELPADSTAREGAERPNGMPTLKPEPEKVSGRVTAELALGRERRESIVSDETDAADVLLRSYDFAAPREPAWTGAGFYMENDLFSMLDRLGVRKQEDRNYTMGLAYERSGRWVQDARLDYVVRAAERLSLMRYLHEALRNQESFSTHSARLGVSAFTPDSLGAVDPILNDRPYASLVYFRIDRRTLVRPRLLFRSSVTVGALGWGVAEAAQTGLHVLLRGGPEALSEPGATPRDPKGWPHQIADGGRVTGRVSFSGHGPLYRSPRLGQSWLGTDLQLSGEVSAGYYSYAAPTLGFRIGRINDTWGNYQSLQNPLETAFVDFAQWTDDDSAKNRFELYLWGTARPMWIPYNALLRGFHGDPVRVKDHETTVFTYQVGASATLKRYAISWLWLAGRSPDLADGPNRKWHHWGGLYITHRF